MSATIPLTTIFHQGPGAVFLVVNWRERAVASAPARLLQLSLSHSRRYATYRALGCSEAFIHQRLFAASALAPGHGPAPRRARELERSIPGAALRGWSPRGLGWGLSAGMHLAILVFLCSIYWVMQKQDPTPPVTARLIMPPAPVASAKPVALRLAELSDPDAVFELQEPHPSLPAVEALVVDDEAESSATDPQAAHPAVVISQDSAFTIQAMVGAGAAGAFTSRSSAGRHRALGIYGGSAGSEAAVDAALRWFKRHQGRAGLWDLSTYPSNCQDAPRCEPDGLASGNEAMDLSNDCAMTGCALLCFLGAGFDQQVPSRYRDVVARGLDWLVSVQGRDGFFGSTNYTNAIATMAICEAYALSHDGVLRQPAQRGVDAILRHQNHGSRSAINAGYAHRMGWDYVGPDARNDTSVTGWNVMALKSAHLAGLDVGQGLDGAIAWLDTTWEATNPQWQDLTSGAGTSRFPYAFQQETMLVDIAQSPSTMRDLASVGAVSAAFLPHPGSPVELSSMARYIIQNQMGGDALQPYYCYYSTLALFQLGGAPWQTWNGVMRDRVVGSQIRGDGCTDGSWDTQNGGYGRMFNTALNCLTLEVYYRYQRLQGPPAVRYPDGWHHGR